MSQSADFNAYYTTSIKGTNQWLRIFLLPALLLALVYITTGFYYETNDDTTVKLILQGKAADFDASCLLYVYLPLWSDVLIAFYSWMPSFPWYDALMVGSYYVALVASFYVLERILTRPNQAGFRIALVEILYFGVTYPLHLMQVNFTRPAILLGAAAVALLAIPTTDSRSRLVRWAIAGLLFVVGWGIRAAGADLGAALVMPLLLLLLRPKVALQAGAYILTLVVVLTLSTTFRQTAADKAYKVVQDYRIVVTDYERAVLVPRTPADSVAASSVKWYAVPFDPALVNESFFQRCMQPVPQATIRAAWMATLGLIVRDTKQWALTTFALVALGGLLVWRRRQQASLPNQRIRLLGYMLYQLFFIGVYIGIGLWFHQVPRVSQPLLSLYLFCNLLLLGGVLNVDISAVPKREGVGVVRWAYIGLVSICALLSVERGWRLYQTESGQEKQHADYLAALHTHSAGKIILEGGLNEVLVNLKLFKDYRLQDYSKFITLMNWLKFDPGQERLLLALTQQPDIASALVTLGHKPQSEVTWLLKPSQIADITRYLNLQLKRGPGQQVYFVAIPNKVSTGDGPQSYALVDGAATPK